MWRHHSLSLLRTPYVPNGVLVVSIPNVLGVQPVVLVVPDVVSSVVFHFVHLALQISLGGNKKKKKRRGKVPIKLDGIQHQGVGVTIKRVWHRTVMQLATLARYDQTTQCTQVTLKSELLDSTQQNNIHLNVHRFCCRYSAMETGQNFQFFSILSSSVQIRIQHLRNPNSNSPLHSSIDHTLAPVHRRIQTLSRNCS